MNGFVYKITNLVNNKVYIGITTTSIEKRWKEHKKEINNRKHSLYCAFKKYGRENFSIEKIDTATSINELQQKEIEYINFFNSYKNGYNMTHGGDYDLLDYRKNTSKQVCKFNLNGEFIEKYSSIQEAAFLNNVSREPLAQNCKKMIKSAGGFLWAFEGETPIKFSNNTFTEIEQWDLEGKNKIKEHQSIKEASKETGVNYRKIVECVNFKKTQHSAGGFLWCRKNENPIKKTTSKIIQMNSNKEIIEKFSSLREIQERLGISRKELSKKIPGMYKGYYWEKET